jgi:glutathione S-transferase
MTIQLPAAPIKVYSAQVSGHSHRVRLFLSLLGLPFETVEIDLKAGAHKTADFLRRNAFGQVPVIEDGAVTIADSNAILVYLAERYSNEPGPWYPREPAAAARVQRWLSVAAGQLAAGPAAARVIALFGIDKDPKELIRGSHALLHVMEGELQKQDFLAGDRATIADVANYSYVAHAPEGGVSLDAYPGVRAWLARIEALPGFVPMQASRCGLLS